ERTGAAAVGDRVSGVLGDAVLDAQTITQTGVATPTLAQRKAQYKPFLITPHPFTDISYVDPSGIERVRVSKDATARLARRLSFRNDPAFLAARRGDVGFGSVAVRSSPNGRQVVMPIAVPDLTGGGVIRAPIDLDLLPHF